MRVLRHEVGEVLEDVVAVVATKKVAEPTDRGEYQVGLEKREKERKTSVRQACSAKRLSRCGQRAGNA